MVAHLRAGDLRAMRGGTVTMNFYDPDGTSLDYRRVEELAGAQRISLRTGCFCNPGRGRDGGRSDRRRHARGAGAKDRT